MKLHQSERNNLAAAAVVWYPTFNCPDITRTFNVQQEVTKIKIKKTNYSHYLLTKYILNY